ncbi:MAG: glucose-6-phosphate dehydrogenase [Fusobacteria bacterium]|nr:glucose-6-phosphate dehydrogenase [Fusobacteriota bacterium]
MQTSKTYGEFCEIVYSGPCAVVIFGASGDLTKRKLLPALFNLFITRRVPKNFYILGYARTILNDLEYRKIVKESLKKSNASDEVKEEFMNHIFYKSGSYDASWDYVSLKSRLEELNLKFQTQGNIIYNLSVPPNLYMPITRELGENGLVKYGQNSDPFQRIVIEKPFGRDLTTSEELSSVLHKYVSRSQTYRIDHYLGKDTVQNIFVFRFANSLFEPVWNRNEIDHVQITVAEDLGIGSRAGYFENSGQIRDMLQNHMLQLLAFVAMEPPTSFEEDSVRDEVAKVFKAIRPYDLENLDKSLVLGQYSEGEVSGEEVISYTSEKGVLNNSLTETYFATKMFIDNWRWQGVPFYLRCGKRMNSKESKISIVFKKTPQSLFKAFGIKESFQNVLTFNIHPEQGVKLTVQEKIPNAKMCIGTIEMNFNYQQEFGANSQADYDSLLLDCMLGDQTLFWRGDGVNLSWKLLTPVLDYLDIRKNREKMVFPYIAGSSGPIQADELLTVDGRSWL